MTAYIFQPKPTSKDISKELRHVKRINSDLLEALIAALPYVEMAEHDESYKAGAVSKMVCEMKSAIAKATGESK